MPKAIDHVQLTGPNSAVTCGQPFDWTVTVCDSTNTPIAGSIPVHVRLLAADGVTVLREMYAGATASGVSGTFVLPANLVGGSPMLKATELFTGTSSSQTISYTTVNTQTLLPQGTTPPSLNTPVAATLQTNGHAADSTAIAAQNAFGPHLRDLAISSDGAQVLCSAMNWDQNLYAVSLSTGAVNWRQRAGQYWTFCPQATSNAGFAVQGFNFGSAEGYGEYLISSTGALDRRFQSDGVANRDFTWLVTEPTEADPTNNFTVSPDGSWVASVGNLGLAVWNSSGTLLWSQSWSDGHVGRVQALGTGALLVTDGLVVTCYAVTGVQNWQTTLDAANSGIVTQAAVSSDSSTVALLTSDQGGMTFVLSTSTGAVTATFPSIAPYVTLLYCHPAQEIGINANGSLVAIASANQLQLFSVTGGLQWVFQGDSFLHSPRFNASNTDVVCCSELGTVDVFTTGGSLLLEQDMGALCAAAWVGSGTYAGDLILASWEGGVYEFAPSGSTFVQAWSTLLQPTTTNISGNLLSSDGAPVTKVTTWSNALPVNYPITPNLLSPATAYISYVCDNIPSYQFQATNLPFTDGYYASALLDGSATPPANPWVSWENIYNQGSGKSHIQVDAWNTMMQVSGITLWENPSHPESWIRNATLDWWNPATQAWVTGPQLLSDQATHTHLVNPPLQTPRVRITLPANSPSNVWLGEVVLNGAMLGCSHPDVVAGNNTCTLFDKNSYPFTGNLMGGAWSYEYGNAASGSMYLEKLDTNLVTSTYVSAGAIGATLPDWNMKIVQTPQNANEFRYLQFAWKAVDPNVTGMCLSIGAYGQAGGYCGFYCGPSWAGNFTNSNASYAAQTMVSSTVPTGWTVVTEDLWPIFQSYGGTSIKDIDFGSVGGTGEVAFDDIVLYKTNPTGSSYTQPTVSSFTTNYASYTATYSTPANVVMTAAASDPNSGGSITKVEFYNADQLVGTATSSPYSCTWTVSTAGSYALTARAYDNFGLQTNSGVVNITVTNTTQVAPPYFSEPAGTYAGTQAVAIATLSSGATIYYTTNGSTPSSTAGTLYSIPVTISANATLEAIAYANGLTASPVSSSVYTIQCAVPSFTPAAGEYGAAQTVTISTATGGAAIRYTTNGTTPSSTVGTLYSSAVSISGSCTLQAIAYATGMASSNVNSGLYTLQVPGSYFIDTTTSGNWWSSGGGMSTAATAT